MCKILMVVVAFLCAHINSTFLGHDLLLLILMNRLFSIQLIVIVQYCLPFVKAEVDFIDCIGLYYLNKTFASLCLRKL